jgi:hypothetical protein
MSYRKLLDNKDIDAVIVGTNGHWHVLPTIHACQAGKDVYVEKPLGTSIGEGRAAVQAARKYNRVVQIGTQQASWPHYRQAIESARNVFTENVHIQSLKAHAEVFLDSIRTRKKSPADVELGHRATSPGHLLNIAWRTGRRIRWDNEREQVIDDPEANALVTKQYRAPWKLEV